MGLLSILMVDGWLAIEDRTEIGIIVAFMSGYERMTGPARDLLNFYRRLSIMRVQYGLVADAFGKVHFCGRCSFYRLWSIWRTVASSLCIYSKTRIIFFFFFFTTMVIMCGMIAIAIALYEECTHAA